MPKAHSETAHAQLGQSKDTLCDTPAKNGDALTPVTVAGAARNVKKTVSRGIAASLSTKELRSGIWSRALLTANRFRVIRTIDIAVCCFPERPFKASLTAAQRAVRGLVKAGYLKRYRSDRFQTIYGICKKGADYLEELGFEAASSVRRVSDMTNPEHRLWAQFWVLCCEARGLKAVTEQELLRTLSESTTTGKKKATGLLTVSTTHRGKDTKLNLVPDAYAYEGENSSGIWLEIDKSKRGSARETSLSALYMSVGRQLNNGVTLRTVIIFCKTERIRKRAVAVVNSLVASENDKVLIDDRRHFVEIEPNTYEVIGFRKMELSDGRTLTGDGSMGHIIIQMLPTWLPKVRIDATNTHSIAGWFGENYLPFKKPASKGSWTTPSSPLLSPLIKPQTK
jgi:hypothetical protein